MPTWHNRLFKIQLPTLADYSRACVLATLTDIKEDWSIKREREWERGGNGERVTLELVFGKKGGNSVSPTKCKQGKRFKLDQLSYTSSFPCEEPLEFSSLQMRRDKTLFELTWTLSTYVLVSAKRRTPKYSLWNSKTGNSRNSPALVISGDFCSFVFSWTCSF